MESYCFEVNHACSNFVNGMTVGHSRQPPNPTHTGKRKYPYAAWHRLHLYHNQTESDLGYSPARNPAWAHLEMYRLKHLLKSCPEQSSFILANTEYLEVCTHWNSSAQHKILQHCGNQHDRYVRDLTKDIQREMCGLLPWAGRWKLSDCNFYSFITA